MWLILLFCVTSAMSQSLRLPAVFADHMVLQRDKEVPIWGWAEPQQEVSLVFNGQTVTTRADAEGRWKAAFQSMPAGGPYELKVNSGNTDLKLVDVMVGEVWLCSGQSNMDMRLIKIWDDERIERDLQREGLRLFRVDRAIADEPQDDVDARWAECEPSEARMFSAVAYFMGAELQRELGVTVGLIHTAYGGTPAEAWTPLSRLSANPELSPIPERWEARIAKYKADLKAYESAVAAGDPQAKKPSEPPARYAPGGLFNAMVHPLIPYAVRGAVWYQGESNTWRAMQYEPLLGEMIHSWRDHWGQGSLPFGVVQLPNYEVPPRVPPGVYSWAELREAQLHVSQELDEVGLAVTIDIGDPTDIHPVDKEPIGKRLARWALSEAYGNDLIHSGPIYTGYEIVDDKVYLEFENIGSGLEARGGGPIKGFVIAGSDRKFRWAKAVVEGDRLVVSEAKVKTPLAVRYAWADNPYWANLINAEGLPASPFRTDDWEGITQDSR
ncbi:sialate O-acetylesterase [Algisphaera agarilytica]|uniref:Sialate O-acetylesterase n=2 Tax=Algisphaera agarilytica TaxID=1385975 RepID=A0A7X0LJX9_9BACT|nr:sialate O-acetylesterase [Algisphaera agarilytica]